jgi:hypothetical protein
VRDEAIAVIEAGVTFRDDGRLAAKPIRGRTVPDPGTNAIR